MSVLDDIKNDCDEIRDDLDRLSRWHSLTVTFLVSYVAATLYFKFVQ